MQNHKKWKAFDAKITNKQTISINNNKQTNSISTTTKKSLKQLLNNLSTTKFNEKLLKKRISFKELTDGAKIFCQDFQIVL